MQGKKPRSGKRLLRGARGAEVAAVSAITQQIRNGRYAQGQKLSEIFLAQDLKLSRNTVREALRSVSLTGLVTLEPNKGARVACLDRQNVAAMLQLREVVEGLGASLAAANINLHQNRDRVAKLISDIDELRGMPTKRSIPLFFSHNEVFHDIITQIASNPYVADAVKRLIQPSLRPAYFSAMDEEAFRNSLAEHEQIALAVLDGDAVTAEAVMKAHVRRTLRSMVRLSEVLFSRIFQPGEPSSSIRRQ
jgi:DNA-binding GntR family transcriptional regulator